MKQFDLEEWRKDQSKKIVTRDGQNVVGLRGQILHGTKYLYGILEKEERCELWKEDGTTNAGGRYDLFFYEEPIFKVGDRIRYRGHLYRITNVDKNWYDVVAIPPYDGDGIKCSIGFAAEKDIISDPDPELTELQKYLKSVVNSFYQRVGEPAEIEAMTSEGAIKFSEEVINLVKKQLKQEFEENLKQYCKEGNDGDDCAKDEHVILEADSKEGDADWYGEFSYRDNPLEHYANSTKCTVHKYAGSGRGYGIAKIRVETTMSFIKEMGWEEDLKYRK